MAGHSFPLSDVRSLWQETAGVKPAPVALTGDHQCDVAIIGGGYTGLSTARYVAARGLRPVVLEASQIGWGASGRNGGVVSDKFRRAFSDIAATDGADIARRMHDLALEAVEHVGELIEVYRIDDADYRPNGSLKCAHNDVSFREAKREADWLRDILHDRGCKILGAEELRQETGSSDFVGGVLNVHGGIIHPLNFALGIARGLKAAGIDVFERTPATRIGRNGSGVIVETPNGSVNARQVIIATNSYSDLTPATRAVRNSIIPFRSAMVATAVLPPALLETMLPTDRSYTETRRMMRWFRKAKGRLMYGGRGAFGKTDSESAFAALEKAMVGQFPQLEGVEVTHRWSGLVAMTMDSLPHLGRIDDRVTYAVGYNGTGIAMSSNIGKYVAALAAGERPDLGLLTSGPLKPVPFYSIREPAVRLVAGWYQFLDSIGR